METLLSADGPYPSAEEESFLKLVDRGRIQAAGRALDDFVGTLGRGQPSSSRVLSQLLHVLWWRLDRRLSALYGRSDFNLSRFEVAGLLATADTGEAINAFTEIATRTLNAAQAEHVTALCPTRRARIFVDEHFRESIGTRDVAGAVAVTESHLCAVFRDVHGQTVGHYIRERRVGAAKALLVASNELAKSVAFSSGFPSYKAFLRTFKETVGMTPLEYRSAMRKDED